MTPRLALLWLLATAACITVAGLAWADAGESRSAENHWRWVEMRRGRHE